MGWSFLPRDDNYWNPKNTFNKRTARFLCRSCGAIASWSAVCPDCGSNEVTTATGRGFPGLFCQSCYRGRLHWDCPHCGSRQKLLDVLQYDPAAITLEPGRIPLLKALFGRK